MDKPILSIKKTISYEARLSNDPQGRCTCGADAMAQETMMNGEAYISLEAQEDGTYVTVGEDETNTDSIWDNQFVVQNDGMPLLVCENKHYYVNSNVRMADKDEEQGACILSEADILAGRDEDCTQHEHEDTSPAATPVENPASVKFIVDMNIKRPDGISPLITSEIARILIQRRLSMDEMSDSGVVVEHIENDNFVHILGDESDPFFEAQVAEATNVKIGDPGWQSNIILAGLSLLRHSVSTSKTADGGVDATTISEIADKIANHAGTPSDPFTDLE